MALPETIRIEDAEGGKQVCIINPESGVVFHRFPVIFTSPNGQYPAMDKFIADGITDGFSIMH